MFQHIRIVNPDTKTKAIGRKAHSSRPPEAVVLHPDAFQRIADLTDAPVPVQITW